jgi:hypothetical protein
MDGPLKECFGCRLLDDLNHPAGPWIDQYGVVVHDRVAIITCSVFRRNVIIADAFFRQYGPDPKVLAIFVGGMVPLDNVAMEAGTLVDTEHAVDAADNAAHDTTDNRADWPGSPFPFP